MEPIDVGAKDAGSFVESLVQQFLDAHNEVMDALPIANFTNTLAEAWEGPGVLDGVKEFIRAVDWTEPFFLYLATFQVITIVGIIAFSWNSTNRTAIAMVFLLVLVLAASPLNDLGSAHHTELFVDSKTNYFDAGGIFVAAVYVAPLLVTAVLLQIKLFYGLMLMMIKVQRAKLRDAARTSSSSTQVASSGKNERSKSKKLQ